MPSFDIVSKVDMQEVDNAVNQARKEILNRYDLKNSKTSVNWDSSNKKISISSEDDYKLSASMDILKTRLVRRNIPLKNLRYGDAEKFQGSLLKQEISIEEGISADHSKNIIKIVKYSKLKIQAQRMDDMLRVTGKKIDDLQEDISIIKNNDMELDLQFINMRS